MAAANEQMGFAPEGPLPSQADRLLAIMGLPRANGAAPPPPSTPAAPNAQVQVLTVPPHRAPPPPAQQGASDFAPRVLRR
jgi:hypothetical protein